MPREQRPVDPYAAPHAPKDKSGPVVRVAIIAVLLGGAALGWSHFSSQAGEAAMTAPAAAQEQAALDRPIQVADSGATGAPEAAPAPAPEAAAPDSAPQPRAQRTARPAPPAQNVPPPTTTIEPTAPPAPVQRM